jgi:hypothetical protein
MAVMRYDPDSDITYAESVNITSGGPLDTDEPASKAEESTERLYRERYPLLCARFLDGYTEAQCARWRRVSLAGVRALINSEHQRAVADPMLRSGLGRALVTGGKR